MSAAARLPTRRSGASRQAKSLFTKHLPRTRSPVSMLSEPLEVFPDLGLARVQLQRAQEALPGASPIAQAEPGESLRDVRGGVLGRQPHRGLEVRERAGAVTTLDS